MKPQLFDTHCHLHEAERRTTPVYDKWHEKGEVDADTLLRDARRDGVGRLLCIGTTLADSELAREFVQDREELWASIGIHPHEASAHLSRKVQTQFAKLLEDKAQRKIVAIGECGLDYFYSHSPRAEQLAVLRFQIELALEHDLPLVFHVREAFDDFWPIFESYRGIRGVLHSFTDSMSHLEHALSHGLYIGVNGIATFTKDPAQLAMYRAIPLDRLLLETDAPFLTPTPYRGTLNEPKYILVTADFVSKLRGQSLQDVSRAATDNANELFGV